MHVSTERAKRAKTLKNKSKKNAKSIQTVQQITAKLDNSHSHEKFAWTAFIASTAFYISEGNYFQ